MSNQFVEPPPPARASMPNQSAEPLRSMPLRHVEPESPQFPRTITPNQFMEQPPAVEPQQPPRTSMLEPPHVRPFSGSAHQLGSAGKHAHLDARSEQRCKDELLHIVSEISVVATGSAGSSNESTRTIAQAVNNASGTAPRMQLANGPQRNLHNIQLINNPGDDGWSIIGTFQDNPKCYLPRTLFQVAHSEYKEAQKLEVGDRIMSYTGAKIDVAYVGVHPRQKRDLVTLRTAQAEITVTHDHRVVVPTSQGMREVPAASLTVSDSVCVGGRVQNLTKVIRQPQQVTEIFELRFNPDEPVEARMLPSWGILTKGARAHWNQQPFGPLGPNKVGPERRDKQRREHSCPPRC